MSRPGSQPPPAAQAEAEAAATVAGGLAGEEPLADDARVDPRADEAAVLTEEVLGRLDRELIGWAPVKTRIRESAAL
ncbi:MAG: hypothetical protein ACRD0M_04690, partial [Acidimicrobiales bacterium]